jgi:multisubunit Na+/H+ antiporter MnhB subunit
MTQLLFDRLSGIIVILFGIYGLLLAYRILPRNPKDPERAELWYRKFGGVMKILTPIMILFGIALLFGWLA